MKRRRITYCITVIVVLIGISVLLGVRADAGEGNIPDNMYKCYKSVEIMDGDTLWKIADRYADSRYVSKSDYIEEIKQINNLSDDTIHAGNYITISYLSCIR